MTAKLLSVSLLAIVMMSSSCTDSPSVAGEYLSKSKYSSGSKDASPDGADQGGDEGGETSTGDEGGETDSEVGTGEGEGDGEGTEPVVMDPVVEKPVDMTPPATKPDPVKPDPVVMDPVKPAGPVYADVKTKFFDKFCVGCHGAAGGVSLESYADVKDNLTAVKTAVASGKMPKAGAAKPSTAEKQLLTDWIAAGAPEK